MFPMTPTTMPAPTHACLCGYAMSHPVTRKDAALAPAPPPGSSSAASGLPENLLSRLTQSGDLLWHTLAYIPNSTFLLGRVSHGFHQFIAEGVKISITTIFRECSLGNSALYSYVNRLKASHEASLGSIHGNLLNRSLIPSGLSPEDTELRLCMTSHASLAKTLRSLGAIVPGQILSPGDIAQYSNWVQPDQDTNLERVWGPLRAAILAVNPGLEGIPEANVPAEDVRNWIRVPVNQSSLGRIPTLDLRRLNLTCVPMEIRLCTTLQTLDLSSNELSTLGPRGFEGLVALRWLYLRRNQLTTLGPMAFEGLIRLQRLNLGNNRIVTVASGAFEGLVALRWLNLYGNQMTCDLAPETFKGLRSLQCVYISNDPNKLD